MDLEVLHTDSNLTLLKSPLTLASKSEGACLFALNKYCNFIPEMGVNVQISLDRYRKADFLIDKTYIEYHPIVLQREFDSNHAQYRFNKLIKKLPKWAKYEVTGILLNEFGVRYYKQRKMLIDNKHKNDEHDLIVSYGGEGFYNDVIKRFAEKIPPRKTFLEEFDYYRKQQGFNEILEMFNAIKI